MASCYGSSNRPCAAEKTKGTNILGVLTYSKAIMTKPPRDTTLNLHTHIHTHTLNSRSSYSPGSTVWPVAYPEGIQSPCALQSQVRWHGACHWLTAPSLWAGSPLGDSALGRLPLHPNWAVLFCILFKFVYHNGMIFHTRYYLRGCHGINEPLPHDIAKKI